MVLYESGSDTGSVAFAEQQMEGVRQRKEAVAKEEEKFSRRVAIADFAVQGANALLNSRADALERNQVPQRAAYEATLENSSSWRGVFNGIKSAGQTNSDYLLNKYYQNALSAMSNKYSGVAENDPNFNKLVMEEAERLRDENLEAFNNLEKAVFNIPTFENFPEFYESHNTLPRSVGSWISNGVSTIFNRHTEESITLQGQQVSDAQRQKRDAIFGTEIGQQLTDIQNTIDLFDNNGFLTQDLSSKIEAGIANGDILGEAGEITTRTFTEQLSDGSIKEVVQTIQLLTDAGTREKRINILDEIENIIRPDDPIIGMTEQLNFTQGQLNREGAIKFNQITKELQDIEGMYSNTQLTNKGFLEAITRLDPSDYARDLSNELQILTSSTQLADIQYQSLLNTEFTDNEAEGLVIRSRSSGKIIVNPDREDALGKLIQKGIDKNLLITENIKFFGAGTDLVDRFLNPTRVMEAESSPTRGESLSGLVYTDSYSGVFENEEQKRTISEALARMADDPSNLPSFIGDVIADAVQDNPDKGIYVLNENNPFSLGEITDQFTGTTLEEDTTDKNILLLWDDPNQRLSYITTEEGTPIQTGEDRSLDTSGELALDTEGGTTSGGRNPRTVPIRYELKEGIFNTAVDKVDISNLTAGQLKTLSEMNDNEIRDKLELDSNISLRTPVRGTFGSRFDNPNVISRAESLIEENELRRWQDISGAEVPQEFWDSLKSLLIEGSRTYLQEDE